MQRLLIILLLFSSFAIANSSPSDKARGIFVAIGVGPRVPVFDFSKSTSVGYGFNLELSYTDNESIPIFLFGKVGFEQYSASQSYYQTTQYSQFSTQFIPFQFGVRYYLPPIFESITLIVPNVEIGVNFSVFQSLHQFKFNSGRANYVEDGSMFGISAGVGVSMFLVETLVSYNYFSTNQYLGFDLKVRLPLFVIL